MFGRRRHAAATPAMPAPQLSDEAVFEAVHRTLAEFMGADGSWTVVRRSADDHDTIFRDVLTHSVATDVVTALREARARLTADPDAAAETSRSAPAAAPAADAVPDEPGRASVEPDDHAPAWSPAPITVWADLRKPVTGEIPVARHDDMVA